ncbi:uncharacterized protein LOC108959227 isoform X1 [Eucalyptus grandis]|uniref:uncharacterized protein LOC108959227 isoform X1 n=1 Tax=Eucalyptus grandis TaxID=71139 RepID=UPI00192EB314|nr:uncharacterized protein LOC108959227 isoform X1 [Eucalyptus grandis]
MPPTPTSRDVRSALSPPPRSHASLPTKRRARRRRRRRRSKRRRRRSRSARSGFWIWLVASVAFRLALIYLLKNLHLSTRPEVATPLTSIRCRNVTCLRSVDRFPIPDPPPPPPLKSWRFHVSRFSFAVARSRTSCCQKILPLFSKHKGVHFNKTDAHLANNGISLDLQRLRCRVNFQALKFTPQIEALGNKLVHLL